MTLTRPAVTGIALDTLADLVADGDVVACRLLFRCRPERTFLGFEPTGETITFAEHAFYEFRDGRIVAVSSLLDVRAVAAQMAR